MKVAAEVCVGFCFCIRTSIVANEAIAALSTKEDKQLREDGTAFKGTVTVGARFIRFMGYRAEESTSQKSQASVYFTARCRGKSSLTSEGQKEGGRAM